ncbi:condensin complex subunit 3 [Anopheles cruzii]|uniref:condensin complex subunit 3 n=1 Tax=Anopheles cruzii TaxID=68878 RepID=UPI0022EC37DD|nr:condensin complex subunit 3 [Anopheles cruzii]
MAPRKRKVAVPVAGPSPEKVKYSTAVIQTVLNAQQNQTAHAKLIKQLKGLYATVQHDSFMKSFLQVVKRQMEHEEANEYANNVLKFCAKFVADPEYSEQAETHPVMASFFNWLLSTSSSGQLVRFRICQLVNLTLNALGSDATLDDTICDKILRIMLERMRDTSQHVRVQAVLALQRLQDPTTPEDGVSRAYIYHLDKDPAAKVRQTIITSLGRNYRSLPHIIERLWDVEERVRRHTYMQMSSFAVRQYKVSQRLKFLEQGLEDHSESVRKVVRNVMIPQWIESYQRDYVAFIEGLKIDADDQELERFRKTSKMVLFEVFSKHGVKEMADMLKFDPEHKHVPLGDLTMERVICWHAMLDYLHQHDSDELEDYMMELSKYCEFIKEFIENTGEAGFMKSSGTVNQSTVASPTARSAMDKLQQLYFQHILHMLLEIVTIYDYADEFGRDSLKLVLSDVLCNETLHEMNVRLIMQTFEKLLPDGETRFKFFVDLVNSVLEPSRVDFSNSSRSLVDTYFERNPDQTSLKLKISALRLEIMDLKEQETMLVQQKDYAGAQRVSERLNACNEEYANLVKPLVQEMSQTLSSSNTSAGIDSVVFRESMLKPRRMTQETINKCLQVCFYLVNSASVRTLTPVVCDLYKSFISRHVQSPELHTRNWALRTSTAFSMLYDGLSKDTFQLLYQQFLHTASTRLWKTAIECVFELLDRYGFEHFDLEDDSSKDDSRASKSSRQLFNRHSGAQLDESGSSCNSNEFYKMSIHFMDTCDESAICKTIIEGFCRLVLHFRCNSPDIVSKLLLRYFNPTTEPETQQILGIFFEALANRKRQDLLQKALLGTLFTILEAPNTSPLAEVRPETVVKFVINLTQPVFCNPGVHPHNTIAVTFLRVMQDNLALKDLLKLMSGAVLGLDISEDPALRTDLATAANEILQEPGLDPKIVKSLTTFRERMRGTMAEPLSFSSSRVPTVNGSASDEQPLAPADGGEEEEEQEDRHEPDEPDKDRSESPPPAINKSILEEDSDTDLFSSPLRPQQQRPSVTNPGSTGTPEVRSPAAAAGIPNSPVSPASSPRIAGSAIKPLRRSLHFGGTPSSTPARTAELDPQPPSRSADGTFKVPHASAMRKIRAASNRSKPPAATGGGADRPERSDPSVPSSEDEVLVPATQEDSSDGEGQDTSHAEIPETQQSKCNTPLVTSPAASHKAPSSRRRSSRRTSSSTSSSEGDVVNSSPNATQTSRINRSAAKPMVAAKTLYEKRLHATPSTMPARTRQANRMETLLTGKTVARKSLSAALATAAASSKSSARTKRTTDSGLERNATRQNQQQRVEGDKKTLPSGAETRKSRTTRSTESSVQDTANVSKSRSSVRATFGPGTTPPVGTKDVAVASSLPGKRSLPKRASRSRPLDIDGIGSNDSTTSTGSPVRLKRAAVVLTPLSATSLRRAISGSPATSPVRANVPRRPNRKATRM